MKEVGGLELIVLYIRIFEIQIVIVTNEDERTKFIKEVGEETLPEEYGGKAKLRALQDVQ